MLAIITHGVEDTTKDPGERTGRGGLGVEETQVRRRGEHEGDALERVLVRALGTVELLWEVSAIRQTILKPAAQES